MRESRLLEHVARHAARPTHVIVPPGDDLAAIDVPAGPLLVGVDQVVDGCHLDLASTPLAAVGWKAVARSVSDIAAMAGRPTASLASVVLPRTFAEADAIRLFDAVRQAADRLGVPLVGGDIAVHASEAGPLVLSITVLGTPGPGGIIRRDGARPGDRLCVTGRLGGSLEPGGGGRHLAVEPRVEAGLELAAAMGPRLHALIDLSDGLGRDAGRMARASGVVLEIDADALPRHPGVDWRGAVGDGEDYELLAAVAGSPPPELAGVTCTVIGRVVAAADPAEIGAVRLRVPATGGGPDEVIDVAESGWDHRGEDETPSAGADR